MSTWVCGVLLLSPVAGQMDSTFRSTTRLVHVNVVVNDKQGNPVEGLKAGDFEISDKGVRQQVRFFTVESASVAASRREAMPPDVVSNDWQRGLTHDVFTVVLLDPLNTVRSDVAYARQEILRFLSQVHPADRVAVYVLGNRLQILQDFTNDPKELMQKVSAYRIPLLDSHPLVGSKITWTIVALQAIAHHLAGLPGRKNLIWVSSAFPLMTGVEELSLAKMGNFSPELRQAAMILNEADIAVSPVDARGLFVPAQIGANLLSMNSTNLLTMTELARQTGGRAFFSYNDIQGALRHVIDSSRVSYTLGFYPSSARGDGSYHPLSVRVNRPGVVARCRQGYFDLPGERSWTGSAETAAKSVLANNLEATGLGLAARVQFAGATKLVLEVQIEPGGIVTEEQAGKRVAVLDIVAVPMDSHGVSYSGVMDPFTLRLDRPAYEMLLRSGVRYRRIMEFDRRASLLRIIVRDRTSGAMGSVTAPLSRRSNATTQVR